MAIILVVEDCDDSMELTTRFLRRSGHVVLQAGDGEAGIRAATEYHPDLIVMDLDLPGLDGWEAAKQIRLNDETAHIPLIALTAHSLVEDVRKARDVGFDAYETKPLVYQR